MKRGLSTSNTTATGFTIDH